MRIFFIFLSLIATTLVFAQAPQKLSYQMVVRDQSNTPITENKVGVKIEILEGGIAGNVVFSELHDPQPNDNGLVSFVIGDGINTAGSLEDIDWSADSYFIKTSVDPQGGLDHTIESVSQLLSVPYARHAGTVDSFEIEEGGIDLNHLSIENAEEGDILRFNGVSWERVPERFELKDANTVGTDKNVDIGGELHNTNKTGEANLTPIAYGVIRNEEISVGTGNFSISKGTSFSGDYYEINIDNEHFIYYNYIALTTSVSEGTTRVTSNSGRMRVYTYDENGESGYLDFYFVVYKP